MTRQSAEKNIVLGVTGSVAAYKAVELLRLLKDAGHDVRVVQTPASRNFVGEATFRSVSGHDVEVELFPDGSGADPAQIGKPDSGQGFAHIDLARSDLLVIAPATANTIGKMAAGIADNLLLSIYLATGAPVAVCPAMNHMMWKHPAVHANIATLKQRGVHIIGPEEGALACGESGEGRMTEPADIANEVERILSLSQPKDLKGVNILITAGATREPIDSVRFITNRSSGKMGLALAEAARARGAEVTVIAANCHLERVSGVRFIDVSTSAELEEALHREYDNCEVLLMAAAVADYKVSSATATGKIERKGKNDLQLEPTSDIVCNLKASRNGKLKVGFAAEFGAHEIERARRKLSEKDLGMIVFNDISRQDIGFESDENEITIITQGDEDFFVGKTTKLECANRILDRVAQSIHGQSILDK